MYTMLIQDSDENFAKSLCRALECDSDFRVLSLLHDNSALAAKIECLRPQILLLDIAVSGLNCIRVIQQIKQNLTGYAPVIYVVAPILSNKIARTLMLCEIDFFSVKPSSHETMIENLRFLAKMHLTVDSRPIHFDLPKVRDKTKDALNDAELKNESKVDDLLHSLGASPHLRSTKSLRDVLAFCLNNPSSTNLVTKILYPSIAKIDGITATSVERRIRYSIGLIQQGNSPLFSRLFPYSEHRRITNSEFIFVLTNYLLCR